jgi:type III secretion protein J
VLSEVLIMWTVIARRVWWRGAALLCVAVALTGCKDVLFAKLSEPQANEVLAALSEARIDASKERVDDLNWKLNVDTQRLGEALVYLRDRGLPERLAPTMGEVFKKDGMISTPTEERARYAWALQESIAATLRRIDGVTEVRVHVAMPDNDPLSDHPVATSASVFVKHRHTLDVQSLSPQIKSMVMASVEGLDYRNISFFAYPVDARALPTATPAAVQKVSVGASLGAQLVPQAPTQSASAEVVGWLALMFGGVSLAGVAAWRRDRGAHKPKLVHGPGAHGPRPAVQLSADAPARQTVFGGNAGSTPTAAPGAPGAAATPAAVPAAPPVVARPSASALSTLNVTPR